MSFIPPRPTARTKGALVGGLLARDGRSMLNLLPEKAYTLQMGVTRIGRFALFIVNAPQTVREVLVARVGDFPKHHYLADILKALIGYSLFNANGPAWAQQRRLVDQAFVQAGLRRAFPVMQTAIDDLLARTDAAAATGGPWDADAAMSHVTADIIFRTILSQPLDAAQARQVHAAFRDYQANAQRVMGLSALRLPTLFHRWRCRTLGAAIRAPFAERIHARHRAAERGEAGLPDDMLATLMAACDTETGAKLSEDDIVDQVGTLFLAGHETLGVHPVLGPVPAGLPARTAGRRTARNCHRLGRPRARVRRHAATGPHARRVPRNPAPVPADCVLPARSGARRLPARQARCRRRHGGRVAVGGAPPPAALGPARHV